MIASFTAIETNKWAQKFYFGCVEIYETMVLGTKTDDREQALFQNTWPSTNQNKQQHTIQLNWPLLESTFKGSIYVWIITDILFIKFSKQTEENVHDINIKVKTTFETENIIKSIGINYRSCLFYIGRYTVHA